MRGNDRWYDGSGQYLLSCGKCLQFISQKIQTVVNEEDKFGIKI
jgi:hypothetical protein